MHYLRGALRGDRRACLIPHMKETAEVRIARRNGPAGESRCEPIRHPPRQWCRSRKIKMHRATVFIVQRLTQVGGMGGTFGICTYLVTLTKNFASFSWFRIPSEYSLSATAVTGIVHRPATCIATRTGSLSTDIISLESEREVGCLAAPSFTTESPRPLSPGPWHDQPHLPSRRCRI